MGSLLGSLTVLWGTITTRLGLLPVINYINSQPLSGFIVIDLSLRWGYTSKFMWLVAELPPNLRNGLVSTMVKLVFRKVALSLNAIFMNEFQPKYMSDICQIYKLNAQS